MGDRSQGVDEADREDLGQGHEQPVQGDGLTRVRGEPSGLEVVRHPRQQAGGRRRRVEGANLAEMGKVARVEEQRKPGGRELDGEGGEEGARKAKQVEGEELQ